VVWTRDDGGYDKFIDKDTSIAVLELFFFQANSTSSSSEELSS